MKHKIKIKMEIDIEVSAEYLEKLKKNLYLEIVKNTDIFFSKTHYHNQDYKIVLDKFKNNDKALIYLDPPYTLTDDSMYKGPETNITNINHNQIIKDIHELFINAKCKIIFVNISDYLFDTIFKDYLKIQYDKKYDTRHRFVKHSVFTNFDPMVLG